MTTIYVLTGRVPHGPAWARHHYATREAPEAALPALVLAGELCTPVTIEETEVLGAPASAPTPSRATEIRRELRAIFPGPWSRSSINLRDGARRSIATVRGDVSRDDEDARTAELLAELVNLLDEPVLWLARVEIDGEGVRLYDRSGVDVTPRGGDA